MKKVNVVVIFGGKSVEHDISIITGVQVLNSLDKNKYNIYPVYISKQLDFYYSNNFFNISTFSEKNFLNKKNCCKVIFNKNVLIKTSLIHKKIPKQ